MGAGISISKLPNSQILICWNHIFNDIKFWINKHGGTSDDRKVYDMDIRALLHCESLDMYNSMYIDLKQKWSESFVCYFDENIADMYSGR